MPLSPHVHSRMSRSNLASKGKGVVNDIARLGTTLQIDPTLDEALLLDIQFFEDMQC